MESAAGHQTTVTWTYVPVNGPAGHIVRDVRGVCGPVPAGQLFDLQSEVPQRGGARAAGPPVEAQPASFHPVLRDRQLPGGLRTLCGRGAERRQGTTRVSGRRKDALLIQATGFKNT